MNIGIPAGVRLSNQSAMFTLEACIASDRASQTNALFR
jgi:hypothetical protein